MEASLVVDPPQRGSDYARLSSSGLLERKPGYYAVRLSAVGLVLSAAWASLLLSHLHDVGGPLRNG